MLQFIAILKDSFREAVDGFVIYLMLALSAIVIILLGSISFTPGSPEEALTGNGFGAGNVLNKFQIIFPDRGASTAPTFVPNVQYSASNIEQSAGNSVAFTLNVSWGNQFARPVGDKEKDKDKGPPPTIDPFRYAVYTWLEPPGRKIEKPMRGRGKAKTTELELVEPPLATPANLKAVTEAEMIEFLTYQCVAFIGVSKSDVVITRKPDVAEPEYKFDVRLKNIAGARGWPHDIQVFFGASGAIRGVPLGAALYIIEDPIINGLGAAVTLILSVVITAFFIPNMLRKGSIDLLISKPIGRVQLLVYKYIGGLTFIFLLSSFTIGGVWVVMALRSGLWDPRFLLVIPVLTFTFGILYAVSTTVAVYTRSAIAAILVTLVFMFLMYAIGQAKSFFDMNKVTNQVELPDWSYTLVEGLNNVLPRYKDLDKLTTKLIVDSTMPTGDARAQAIFTEFPSWGGAVGVSLAFIAAMLSLASLRLVKRDC
ncbi:MAG: ABC transporter permease [Planctomycetia bacterium]|nr:ABC transporter permease [Planctomycetia bacterium]